MNKYQIGEVVKLLRNFKASEHLYVIEGYEIHYQYIKGKLENKAVYHLKNTKDGRVIKATSNYIVKPYTVDELLDRFNDYKWLYKIFQDENYKSEMDEIINDLKKIAEYQLFIL